MSREKQIKELAEILQFGDCIDVGITDCRKFDDCNLCKATRLYNAGYRKQSEGEWKVTRTGSKLHIKCLCCNYTKNFDRLQSITDERRYILDDFIKEHRFCPNCGSKMKGGAE